MKCHCVKTVRIQNFSGSGFPAFGPNTEIYFVNERNEDQKNSEYGHFLHSVG